MLVFGEFKDIHPSEVDEKASNFTNLDWWKSIDGNP